MSVLVMRLGILILLLAVIWLLVWGVRLFIERQRRAVLAQPAPLADVSESSSKVRILAFSSVDCSQCHTLQAPALERLVQQYGTEVSVVKVDAVNEPELAQQYRVMTVPTTVVLDARGNAHAVNYGFAPLRRLAEQVDALLVRS